MSKIPSAEKDNQVAVSQLCIGMHVHLDLSWVEHPFTFSSFKIKSLDQISTIQSLGLQSVRYSPAKSDSQPLAPAEAGHTPPPPAPELDTATQAKRDRLARVETQRAKLVNCERELLSTARRVKSLTQNLFSRPDDTRNQAVALINEIADSMLVDSDIAMHLMADKIGNDEVYFHSLNVALLSMMLAREMKAPSHAIRLLGLGAFFHDLGKVDIPDRVLHKTEALTRIELNLLHSHVGIGLDLAHKLSLPPEAMVVIAQHHERADGTGYPKKLQLAGISLLPKIVSVVNVYDNLCNPTDPAKALTPHEALSTMFGQQRTHFDATALTTFVRCMGVYPPGTVVVLSNGALGMVLSVNSSRPLKPTVLVYDAAVPKKQAIIVDLEDEPDVTVTRTMRPQTLPQAAFDYLSPRKRITYYFSADADKSAG